MPTNEKIRGFQQERLADIRHWYQTNYKQLEGRVAPWIRYIVLWSVFNAVYNVADLKNERKIKVDVRPNGRIKPLLRAKRENGDRQKAKRMAARVASDGDFR